MSQAEIPEIVDFSGSVLAGVGEAVEVSLHDPDATTDTMIVTSPSYEMVDQIVREALAREGVPPNRELERLCNLVGRIAVGRLATSSGFTIAFGKWREPREYVDVKLRTDTVPARDAKVTRTPA